MYYKVGKMYKVLKKKKRLIWLTCIRPVPHSWTAGTENGDQAQASISHPCLKLENKSCPKTCPMLGVSQRDGEEVKKKLEKNIGLVKAGGQRVLNE